MAAEKKAGKSKAAEEKKSARTSENDSAEDLSSEVNEPRWSVVSFEKRVAGNLVYAEAVERLEQLRAQKIAGLCIITDEAAARISD